MCGGIYLLCSCRHCIANAGEGKEETEGEGIVFFVGCNHLNDSLV